eukprot:521543-Pyramimonas_sp.AAC.1
MLPHSTHMVTGLGYGPNSGISFPYVQHMGGSGYYLLKSSYLLFISYVFLISYLAVAALGLVEGDELLVTAARQQCRLPQRQVHGVRPR